jgi:hypothetical protein
VNTWRESLQANRSWLPDMDLNHDKQIQSLLCYRYTIGQGSNSLGYSRSESRFPGPGVMRQANTTHV